MIRYRFDDHPVRFEIDTSNDESDAFISLCVTDSSGAFESSTIATLTPDRARELRDWLDAWLTTPAPNAETPETGGGE